MKNKCAFCKERNRLLELIAYTLITEDIAHYYQKHTMDFIKYA